MNSQAIMGVGGEEDKIENGNAGGGGFFESFKVTGASGVQAGSISSATRSLKVTPVWNNDIISTDAYFILE